MRSTAINATDTLNPLKFSVSPGQVCCMSDIQRKKGFNGIRLVDRMSMADYDKEKEFSLRSQRNLRKCLDWFLASTTDKITYCKETQRKVKYRLAFITLTLPAKQFHSDQVIKSECLNQFLVELRDKFGLKKYVWRSEAQKNGNIHFHITIDIYIHWKFIREIWNRCLDKLGYINKFEAQFKHRDPNSIDIHSVKKVKNIVRYLSAYMSKKVDNRAIMGKQYGVSRIISKCKSIICYEGEPEYLEIEKYLEVVQTTRYYCDYVAIYYTDWDRLLKEGHGIVAQLYRDIINSLLNTS